MFTQYITCGTRIPARIIAPCFACAVTLSSCSIIAFKSLDTLPSDKKSISSSGKSIAASTYIRKWITCSTSVSMCFENSPCSEWRALLAACSEFALIKSAIASAWVKSILSLRNARSLNSPGLAKRTPSIWVISRSSISIITGPPWPCNSSTSSPVKEFGPLK